MTDIPVPPNIPWYKSNVLRGIAVSLVSQLIAHLHLGEKFSDADITLYVDDFFEVVSFASAAYAAYARTKHPMPTVQLTKSKADAANATPLVPTPLPEKPP